MYKKNVSFLMIFLGIFLFSQQSKTGTWLVQTLQYKWNSHFSSNLEAQVRALDFFSDYNYYEIKAGTGYQIDKNFSTLLGLGRYVTYDDGKLSREEFRIWEQFTFLQYVERLKFEHRFRVEQRFINSEYENRYRYRLNLLIPLNNKSVKPKTIFSSIYDEIFLTNEVPHFMRNRLYIGLGYQISNMITIQTGFLSQYDYNLLNSATKNYLFFSTQYTFKNKANNEEKFEIIPNSVD